MTPSEREYINQLNSEIEDSTRKLADQGDPDIDWRLNF